MDAGPVDAARTGDATLDAPILDAPVVDSFIVDASIVDAPSAEDVGRDAPEDAGPVCRIRWTALASGASNDLANQVWFDPDGNVQWSALTNPSGTLRGLSCGSSCIASFTRDGAVRFVVPAGGSGGGGDGRQTLVSSGGGSITLAERSLSTGADLGVLDSFGLDAIATMGSPFASSTAMTMYGSFTGAIHWTEPGTLALGRAGYVGHWRTTGGVTSRDWRVVFDGADDELVSFAQLLPDGSVGLRARTGAVMACIDGPRRADDSIVCAPAGNTSLVAIVSAAGVVTSDYVIPTSVQPELHFLADHGAIVETGGAIARRDASGGVVWSRGISGTWNPGVRFLHDPARGRVVALTPFDATTAYDGASLGDPGVADGVGLAVLELDDATGALERSFTFAATGNELPRGLDVDDMGRIAVSLSFVGTIDTCAGLLVADMQDALLLAIE